jgi:hypothetical protein
LQITKLDIPDPEPREEEYVGVTLPEGHRTKKVFVFADDCNILTSLDSHNLERIKKILDDFGEMLGLKCNLQKSNVLLIGDEPVLTDEMRDTGFSLKDSITVLGFTLTNTDELLSNNTSAIVNKVINQVQFWSRLNLSLPGRINICKSMLYSQMNYIGSVLPVPENLIARLEDIIYTYAKGNLNISAKRTFLPTKLGGLGLFGIKNFLDAQKCSWIRKCKNLDQD